MPITFKGFTRTASHQKTAAKGLDRCWRVLAIFGHQVLINRINFYNKIRSHQRFLLGLGIVEQSLAGQQACVNAPETAGGAFRQRPLPPLYGRLFPDIRPAG